MDYLYRNINQEIAAIWENEQYELILFPPDINRFSFKDKINNSEMPIKGTYYIGHPFKTCYPILKLRWMNGMIEEGKDFEIVEYEFGKLILTNKNEKIQLKFQSFL